MVPSKGVHICSLDTLESEMCYHCCVKLQKPVLVVICSRNLCQHSGIVYADDIVQCASSCRTLQYLINALSVHATSLRTLCCNIAKTKCMVCEPKDRCKIISRVFPAFSFDGVLLQFVKVCLSIWSIILSSNSTYDADSEREIRKCLSEQSYYCVLFSSCKNNTVQIILY